VPQDTANLFNDKKNLLLFRELIRTPQIDNIDIVFKKKSEDIIIQTRSTTKIKEVAKTKNKKIKRKDFKIDIVILYI